MPLALWGLSVMSAGAASSEVVMVGLDEQNQPLTVEVPRAKFVGNLTSAVKDVNGAAIQAITARSEKEGGKWLLRSVVVGVGVNAEAGVGPILRVGVLPRFRLGFSYAREPSFP